MLVLAAAGWRGPRGWWWGRLVVTPCPGVSIQGARRLALPTPLISSPEEDWIPRRKKTLAAVLLRCGEFGVGGQVWVFAEIPKQNMTKKWEKLFLINDQNLLVGLNFGELDVREPFWITRGTPVPNLAKRRDKNIFADFGPVTCLWQALRSWSGLGCTSTDLNNSFAGNPSACVPTSLGGILWPSAMFSGWKNHSMWEMVESPPPPGGDLRKTVSIWPPLFGELRWGMPIISKHSYPHLIS